MARRDTGELQIELPDRVEAYGRRSLVGVGTERMRWGEEPTAPQNWAASERRKKWWLSRCLQRSVPFVLLVNAGIAGAGAVILFVFCWVEFALEGSAAHVWAYLAAAAVLLGSCYCSRNVVRYRVNYTADALLMAGLLLSMCALALVILFGIATAHDPCDILPGTGASDDLVGGTGGGTPVPTPGPGSASAPTRDSGSFSSSISTSSSSSLSTSVECEDAAAAYARLYLTLVVFGALVASWVLCSVGCCAACGIYQLREEEVDDSVVWFW